MTLPNPSPSDIIRKALEAFVYETTHLSPWDNGSHWAQISAHTLNYGREALAVLALMEAENARLRKALTLAEDVLARAPYSTELWPNGTHPNTGIEQIRAALAQPGDAA